MGRKSSAKSSAPNTATPPPNPPARSPMLVVGFVAIAVLAGAVMYLRGGTTTAAPESANAAAERPAVPDDLKPHPQATLPPLQFPSYPMQRSADVVTAAYKFAAEHPEILSYVPCYCGCERSGHRGNEDCFVKARDVNGDVVEWEDHGMECAVCLDVATRARVLYSTGASVADIRATIEKEWAGRATTHTPTPDAPHNH